MAAPPRRVVYLCLDGGSGPVEAQVVDHLQLVWASDEAPTVDLLLLGRLKHGKPPSALFSPESAQALRRKARGAVSLQTFSSPLTGVPLTLFHLLRLTFPHCFTRRLILHARAKDGGLLASLFKWMCLGFPRVYFDQRGDLDSEHRLLLETSGVDPAGLRGRLSMAAVRCIEWLCLRSAARVFYVTENLRRMVEERFPFARRIPVAIFPCMADAEKFRLDDELRRRWRTEFGFSPTDRVLAYVGHLQAYQCFDEMIDLIARMAPRAPDLKVLFITAGAHHDLARSRLEGAIGAGRFVVRSLPHHDVPGALNAADAGLILRHRSPVNEAASPTKFAEYILCGLPVVLTEGIGDASRLVREEHLGVALADLSDLDGAADQVAALLARAHDSAYRNRIAAFGRRALSRQMRIHEYIMFYNSP